MRTKRFLITLLMLPALALANSGKDSLQIATYQAACVNSRDLTTLMDEFREIPFVRGVSRGIDTQGASMSLVMFVNAVTGTFTIVERTDADTFCIMAVGAGFEPVPQSIQDRVEQGQNQGRL